MSDAAADLVVTHMVLQGGGILTLCVGTEKNTLSSVVPFAKEAENRVDNEQILDRAMTWMRQRNWREKLAKSKSGQSLYEHSLIEFDAYLQLAPILRGPKRYGLSALENWIVIVALIVHDAGKETAEWQEYVA
jgi:hypothetical protein